MLNTRVSGISEVESRELKAVRRGAHQCLYKFLYIIRYSITSHFAKLLFSLSFKTLKDENIPTLLYVAPKNLRKKN